MELVFFQSKIGKSCLSWMVWMFYKHMNISLLSVNSLILFYANKTVMRLDISYNNLWTAHSLQVIHIQFKYRVYIVLDT